VGGPFAEDATRRIAVVLDAHPLWAEAVEGVLRRVGVDVVGKATAGHEALLLVRQLRPDLLITDTRAEDGERAGLTCLREARQILPELRAIVLAMSEDSDEIDAALEAGAWAYVLKSAHPDDLASAVRQVFTHSVYFATPGAVRRARSRGKEGEKAEGAELTKRELEILRLAAVGYSNAKLAEMLWVTEQTVKFHLSNVYRKLGVSNRTEAARWAQLQGLVETPGGPVAA
jgi:DNA-binding NarL/FixJ family response regulator